MAETKINKNSESRDISGFKPSDLDVFEFFKNQILLETELLGAPYRVRCYPTPYLIKLALQLTEREGEPYQVDANYYYIEYPGCNGKPVVVGANSSEDFRYFSGEFSINTSMDFVTEEERSFKLLIENTDLYKALDGSADE